MAQDNRWYGRSHRPTYGVGGLIGAFLEPVPPNAGAGSRAHPAARRQAQGSMGSGPAAERQIDDEMTEIHKAENHWPYLYRERDRRESILNNTPARILVDNNQDPFTPEPWYASHSMGVDAVAEHEEMIVQEAERTGVDPDLIKAIVYVENSHGGNYGALTEAAGAADSYLPMNVQKSRWQTLAGKSADLTDARANIRAGATLLKRIVDRSPEYSIDKIATLYNNLSADAVNSYGARVSDVYYGKEWYATRQPPMIP